MKQEEIQKIDQAMLWHPCSQMKDYEDYPVIPIDHAKGVWLYTQDGRKILDAVSSWWIKIFGHGFEPVKTRIKEQLDKLEQVIFANYTHESAAQLAAHLTGLFDGSLSRVFFGDNGSSAVEIALKMSYHYWYNLGHPEKKEFLYLSGGYHGETMGALSVSALDLYKKIYEPLLPSMGVEIQGPDCFRCPFGLDRDNCDAQCVKALEEKLEKEAGSISAVIIEPILQAASGMKIYSPLYLKKLRQLCSAYHVHLICDEIAAGFGRTGKMMASDHADITPDFACLSKGLTAGFLAFSAVLTREEIYQAFYDDYTKLRAFMHSHSYTGSALGCAAACAVFETFSDPKWMVEINQKGRKIREALQSLADHPQVGEIRSIGMVTAIELVEDKAKKLSFDWKRRLGYQIYRLAEQRGVLLRNLGDIIYFFPPYVINEEEITFMTSTARSAILEVLQGI
ncbi:MAG: adenosylmethionine--8-amino-7-oxononanoate transaminase [Spirochaetales bacterium]|nr:adenosylmethionine--8-amino-7-oxononanoate transaminase [Spirochaetales bacterium]